MTFSYIVAYIKVNFQKAVLKTRMLKQDIYTNITYFINTYERLREEAIRNDNERQYINKLNNLHKLNIKNKLRKATINNRINTKINSNIYFDDASGTILENY